MPHFRILVRIEMIESLFKAQRSWSPLQRLCFQGLLQDLKKQILDRLLIDDLRTAQYFAQFGDARMSGLVMVCANEVMTVISCINFGDKEIEPGTPFPAQGYETKILIDLAFFSGDGRTGTVQQIIGDPPISFAITSESTETIF